MFLPYELLYGEMNVPCFCTSSKQYEFAEPTKLTTKFAVGFTLSGIPLPA